MIAVAPRTKMYSLRFRGQRESISREALTKLNDSLGARYRHSTAEQQRKICAIVVELNEVYLRNPPVRFHDPMDAEDWFQEFKKLIPKALLKYEPSCGHLMQYIIGWKMASVNDWLNTKDAIRIPNNQRLMVNQMERKMREGLKYSQHERERRGLNLTETEQRFYDQAKFVTVSLNYRSADLDEELMDMVACEDPRETAGVALDGDLWKVVEKVLDADEFQIWKWKYHPDFELTNKEIGIRIDVTHERVRQKLNKIRVRLQKRMAEFNPERG